MNQYNCNNLVKIFEGDSESFEQRKLQEELNSFYNSMMSSPENYNDLPDDIDKIIEIRNIEDAWIKYEDKRIEKYELPDDAKDFKDWYKNIYSIHKDAVKDFFKFLAHKATLAQLAYYVHLEAQVDGRFDDIVALAQIGFDGKKKLVLANNYWDEMGNGDYDKMHTVMFDSSVSYLRDLIKGTNLLDDIGTVASLKNGNMIMMFALRKKLTPRLLGAIGILEDTAPARFSMTVKAMRRHQLPKYVIDYHEEHIAIDAKHGREMFYDLLIPSINGGSKEFMHEICRGVLVRYNIALDYYDSIQNKLIAVNNVFTTS